MLELPVSAYLPEDYMPLEAERIAFYKRLLEASPAGLPSLKEELEDRCGRLPPPAEALFHVARVRHLARRRVFQLLEHAVEQLGLRIESRCFRLLLYPALQERDLRIVIGRILGRCGRGRQEPPGNQRQKKELG